MAIQVRRKMQRKMITHFAFMVKGSATYFTYLSMFAYA
jgi:hypothetical protein